MSWDKAPWRECAPDLTQERLEHNVQGMVDRMQGRCLDLGCGTAKQMGYIGLDHYPFPGVNIVRDLRRGLPFDDDSIDSIYSAHCFEHFAGEDLIFLIEECWRVSKPGAEWTIIVPDATSPNMHKDPMHCSYWYEESFDLWRVNEQGEYLIFVGPGYGRRAKLEVLGTVVNANKDRLYRLRVIK
mgnify:CR=1 FL=1